MEKIFADETEKMVGVVQTYTDPLFSVWISAQSDEYLASVQAFDVWQTYSKLFGK